MLSLNQTYITKYLFPVFSGVLCGLSFLYMSPWLGWIMLLGLFYAVLSDPRYPFLKGLITGTIAGLILYSWMIASSRMYTGTSEYIGYPLWLACSLFCGLVTGTVMQLFSLVRIRSSHKASWWLNALLISLIWIIVEWVRAYLMSGLPWINYPVAVTQSRWILPIQITAFTGIWGLSFIVVAVNALLAIVLVEQKLKNLWLPISLFLVLILGGWLHLKIESENSREPIAIALICENTEAQTRWLPETSDSLASIYLDLNRQAMKSDPDLIIWSESAIPWNLAMDDDLISKSLSITWPSQASHILGIFTPLEGNKRKKHNSAYYIEPDGAITGRYDKVQLLSFLEAPFANAQIPFFRSSAISDIVPGKKHNLIRTEYGNAGILICNEITALKPYRATLKLRPHFLVIMSNDAWFEGSRVSEHHFNYLRLRAVESGKNMVVNSNRGVSGFIHSSGKIQVSEQGTLPGVVSGYLRPSSSQSLYAQFGDWFIYLSITLLIIIIIIILIKFKTNN